MTDHPERFPANRTGVATLPTAPASNGDVAAIDELRALYNKIRAELAKPDDDSTDFADVRQRLAWLLTALRHQRARESDLIYEAYYDAFETELTLDRDPYR